MQLVVTEFGRDKGGGYNDGYKSVMTSEEYVQFIWEAMDAYAPFNVPVCIFCYGHGYHRWDNFNIEHDDVVNQGVARYGKLVPVQALFRGRPVAPALAEGKLLKIPGTYVNVRLYPKLLSGPALGTAKLNQEVEYRRYGPHWYYIHTRDGVRGYVSAQDGLVKIG